MFASGCPKTWGPDAEEGEPYRHTSVGILAWGSAAGPETWVGLSLGFLRYENLAEVAVQRFPSPALIYFG